METRKYRVKVTAVWDGTDEEWCGEINTFGYSARDAAQRYIGLANYLQRARNNGTARYRSIKNVELLGVSDWDPSDPRIGLFDEE
jgi:hypothetical protein